MAIAVCLLVPIKPLDRAKSRLLGVADAGAVQRASHARLALALARDTIAAAAAARAVRRVVAISSDATVCDALGSDGIETVPDTPDAGLNAALRFGEQVVRRSDPDAAIGALQADLPALRTDELDAAIHAGLACPARSFCTDRAGTGTTLLLAVHGHALDPRFGTGSAAAHRASGAAELTGAWPGLRCDVDTREDLAAAAALGIGRHTRDALALPAT